MKMSKMLISTLREVPAEAEIASHQLMLRVWNDEKNGLRGIQLYASWIKSFKKN